MSSSPPESDEPQGAGSGVVSPEAEATEYVRPEITRSPVTATVIGLVAGALSALLGVGGGLLMVPAMALMLRIRQHRAHGTSLAVILPTAIAGVYRYHLAGNVDWVLVLPLAVGGVLGALIGAGVANAMGAALLRRVFGAFVVLVGCSMGLLPEEYTQHRALVGAGAGTFLIGVVGLVAGVLSGLLGVGGGIIMVPAVVFLLGLDQHVAQGVSLAVIIPVSISGAWIHWRKGNLIPSLALWLSVGAVVSATVVGNAVQGIHSDTLRFLFGIFLIIMGVTMFSRRVRPAAQPRSTE